QGRRAGTVRRGRRQHRCRRGDDARHGGGGRAPRRGGGRPADGRGPGRWVMRFEQLREEVARAERRVETRLLRAKTNWRVLGTTWREAWTPGRILVVGLVGGLLVGRARPLDKLGGLD